MTIGGAYLRFIGKLKHVVFVGQTLLSAGDVEAFGRLQQRPQIIVVFA